MKNIYLVRHGESLANLDRTIGKTTADHAVPLSDRGLRQADAAGIALAKLIKLGHNEPLRIWNSPYKRTRQTADALCAHLTQAFPHLDRREDPALCEQQFGLFDGIPEDELPNVYPREHEHYALCEAHNGRFWARMPMGESRFDVTVRIHGVFGSFHRDSERHGIDNIVVICHGVTLRAFVMRWLHHNVEWFEQEPNPGNCDIFHLRVKEKSGEYIYRGAGII